MSLPSHVIEKQNMQPLAEAELPNLLKEVGLLPTVEGLSTQAKDGKLSFGDFVNIVKERLSNIDTAVFDAFEMFDINRDGRISKEEMKKVFAKLQEPLLDEAVETMMKDRDVDGDGKISLKESINGLDDSNITQADKEAFEMFDINRDGYITKEEMKTFMAKQADANNNEEIEAIVQKADIDSDGFINIEEFQQSVFPTMSTMVKSKAQEITKKLREENASLETFKTFDVDGDGFVTAGEIKAVMNKLGISVTDDAVEAIVKAADVDGDGRISLKEIWCVL